MTLELALNQLVKNENLIPKILENLRHYCEQANEHIKKS